MLPNFAGSAFAQDYPTRTVRIIVGFPPGIAVDIVARLVAQRLSERLGQQFIVENRPGAGGDIGAEAVVRSDADGYTLLLASSANAISASVDVHPRFNFAKDIAPVAIIGTTPFIMAVTPSIPAKTLPEFIAYAKAHPGKLNMASPGVGSGPHVVGELFKMMADVNLVHVPYRSSFFADLLSGQVQVAFGPVAQMIHFVKDGKLRALGVTTPKRMDVLPDVPAMAETIPGFEASGWYGVGAPAHTPAAVIDKLNKAINAVVAEPAIKSRLVTLGAQPTSMTVAEAGKFMAAATEKWAKVVKFAGIKRE
jgi:tripartite-type tricarboxylate transporter receptor subunit TctC